MAMRAGFRGENMFLACRPRQLAAITYAPLADVDLGRYGPEFRPRGWHRLAPSQKGSINKFAWQIHVGDTRYGRESARPNMLVARGRVLGRHGELAYFFAKQSPIRTQTGEVWRHLVRVDWDNHFQEIPYKDHSPNTTVLRIEDGEAARLIRSAKKSGYRTQVAFRAGLERAYPRATPAMIRRIVPLHKTLGRQFQEWLWNEHAIEGFPEQQWIDLQFNLKQDPAMAEFKIAYNGNTTAAIREALGQILEYNHYPARRASESWFLVLDKRPRSEDCGFVDVLRRKLRLPLHLGWREGSEFFFFPRSPF